MGWKTAWIIRKDDLLNSQSRKRPTLEASELCEVPFLTTLMIKPRLPTSRYGRDLSIFHLLLAIGWWKILFWPIRKGRPLEFAEPQTSDREGPTLETLKLCEVRSLRTLKRDYMNILFQIFSGYRRGNTDLSIQLGDI